MNSVLDKIWEIVYGFTLLFVFVLIISAIISNSGFPSPGDPLYATSMSLKQTVAASVVLMSLMFSGSGLLIRYILSLNSGGRR